jgi:WD40 repeat protein
MVGKIYERWSNSAELQRKSQLSAKLAADAESQGSDGADAVQLGALLALEAGRFAESDKARDVLKKNLPMLPRLYAQSAYKSDVARAAIVTDSYGTRLTTVSVPSGPTGSAGGYRRLEVRGLPDLKSVADYQFNDDVNNVVLSPDGGYLANVTAAAAPTAAPAGTVSFVPTANMRAQGQPRTSPTTYTVKVFPTGNSSKTVWEGASKGGAQMAFSPNGKLFACANDDGKTFVVTLASGAAMQLGHPDVLNFRFSLDGRYLATYHRDHDVHVWDTGGNLAQPVSSLPNMQGLVAAFSPADGGAIAMIEQVNTIRLYKVGDGGRPISTKSNSVSFKDAVIKADLTPDGKYVIAAIKDGTLWKWEAGSEEAPSQLPLGRSLYKFTFSPDGSLLATVEQSNVVRLWDVTADFKPAGFIVSESQVQMREAAFSRDGKYLATAGTDQAVRVWVVGDNDLGEACSRLTRNLTQAEFSRYLPGEQYHQTCPSLP